MLLILSMTNKTKKNLEKLQNKSIKKIKKNLDNKKKNNLQTLQNKPIQKSENLMNERISNNKLIFFPKTTINKTHKTP